MTARQFLLDESLHCRRKAEGCADRFIAVELRRLAEAFELKAEAPQPHPLPVVRAAIVGICENFPFPDAHPNASRAGEQTGTRAIRHIEGATDGY